MTLAALLAGTLAACSAPPPPTLAEACAVRGSARDRAQAFLRVATAGDPAKRRRAALLWGLSACDVPSPLAAVRAFARAAPADALAPLAARRLEEALARGAAPPELWLSAAASPWLSEEARRRLRLRGAELLGERGAAAAAALALPPLDELALAERARALAVLAAAPDGAAAARRLAVEHPRSWAAAFPLADRAALEKTFTPAEWASRAAALLAAGDADAALRAARRAGAPAALTAARAALRLRRGREALAWADRLGSGSRDGALERAEALRQIAWAGERTDRREGFARALAAAERARRLAGADAAAARRADLLLAEAYTELGRLGDAEAPIARSFERSQPRWEWVWRRLLLHAATQRRPGPAPAANPPASTRVRRIGAFWEARRRARAGDTAAARELADSGFPDLPAQWAAAAAGRRGVTVTLDAAATPAPGPPAWAADLVAAGRVADVVVAWRAELEAGGAAGSAWLGLLHLAEMAPLDAIPLLLRAEPRLLSGPWSGLPRALLAQYLPLPLREDVEAAAARGAVPPWLLAGLVRHESAWAPAARSRAGAVGLAQVLPATGLEQARALGLRVPSAAGVAEPATNLLLGASLLAEWRRAFSGSWTAALAAYNGGERRARAVWEIARRGDGAEFVEALEIPETHDYVHRVALLAEGYRLLYWPEGSPYPWT